MNIKPEQIDRLVNCLLQIYRAKDIIVLKTNEATVRAKIVEIITKDFCEEDAIEDEARKVLAAYAREARETDHQKMFLLIKQKLAKKKGFVL